MGFAGSFDSPLDTPSRSYEDLSLFSASLTTDARRFKDDLKGDWRITPLLRKSSLLAQEVKPDLDCTPRIKTRMILGLGSFPDVAARARRVKAWTRGMGSKVRVASGGLKMGRRGSTSRTTEDNRLSVSPETTPAPPVCRLSFYTDTH